MTFMGTAPSSGTDTKGQTSYHFPIQGAHTVVGTWSGAYNVSAYAFLRFENTSDANYDSLKWSVNLEPGTYRLMLFHMESNESGIMDFNYDGNKIADVDGYNGAYDAHVFTSQNVVTTGTGIREFELKVNGRSGGSHYRALISDLWMERIS